MKVLLATDLSRTSPVVKAAASRPWPSSTSVCILHVVDLTPFPAAAGVFEMARLSAESFLKPMAEELRRVGLNVQTEILSGHPRSAILKYAENWGADFLMIGSHGAGGLARFLLGSVAQAVARSAPCSVEIVRQPSPASRAATGMKILLATDGSASATAAVRSVGSRPWPAKSRIRLVSVAPRLLPVPEAAAPYLNVELMAREAGKIEKDGLARAAEVIASARSLLSRLGAGEVEATEIVSGDAKTVILDEAKQWNADLIVLGSHGWHGIDRVMMGSVSEAVAMHAHCSVEIVR